MARRRISAWCSTSLRGAAATECTKTRSPDAIEATARRDLAVIFGQPRHRRLHAAHVRTADVAFASAGSGAWPKYSAPSSANPNSSWPATSHRKSRSTSAATARAGVYRHETLSNVPVELVERYFEPQDQSDERGHTYRIKQALRSMVSFARLNLMADWPMTGPFDVIFLRNVMIYFNADTKRQVVARVTSRLKPGGHFFIGHSESLQDISSAVQPVIPSVYRKAAAVQPRDRQAA